MCVCLSNHLSVFCDHHQYKYQINIDGTVAAYRLPYLLAGDSVVFKQDSGYYEHFYGELRPWEHYIPVRADLGDLLDKIQWARDHDEEVTTVILTEVRNGFNNELLMSLNFGSVCVSGQEDCTDWSAVCTQSSYRRRHILLLLQTISGNTPTVAE